MSFVYETNYKADLKCCSSWFGGSVLHVILEDFYKKKSRVKKLCKKSIEKNYGISHTRRKG